MPKLDAIRPQSPEERLAVLERRVRDLERGKGPLRSMIVAVRRVLSAAAGELDRVLEDTRS